MSDEVVPNDGTPQQPAQAAASDGGTLTDDQVKNLLEDPRIAELMDAKVDHKFKTRRKADEAQLEQRIETRLRSQKDTQDLLNKPDEEIGRTVKQRIREAPQAEALRKEGRDQLHQGYIAAMQKAGTNLGISATEVQEFFDKGWGDQSFDAVMQGYIEFARDKAAGKDPAIDDLTSKQKQAASRKATPSPEAGRTGAPSPGKQVVDMTDEEFIKAWDSDVKTGKLAAREATRTV
jgi:hypothetical protein